MSLRSVLAIPVGKGFSEVTITDNLDFIGLKNALAFAQFEGVTEGCQTVGKALSLRELIKSEVAKIGARCFERCADQKNTARKVLPHLSLAKRKEATDLHRKKKSCEEL
jgi:hypothetical protein